MKIGIIGLGEVAQLMHLPILRDMGDKFTIVAAADISPSLLNFIREKYRIPQGFSSPEELIEKSDIEGVFILSPDQYHGEYIEKSLRKGRHVFVEKPIALAATEVEGLLRLEQEYPQQVVMVGYMRRYAAPFIKALELLKSSPQKVEYLRFRDIICEGPFYIGQTRPVFYPKDIPAELLEESGERRRRHLDWAIGAEASDAERSAYQMLTGLGCHSFSAVRELFGPPKKILSVSWAKAGTHLVIVMDFGGFLGLYELVNDQNIVQFDAAIEIFQHNRKLLLKYETPYIRHQPMSLEVIESGMADTMTTIYGPSYRDPFQAELERFYDCVTPNEKPKTGMEDALEDLKIFEAVIKKMRESQNGV
jgi:predicted dehydrogenase